MMSRLRSLFSPPRETPDEVETREFKERLIEEHREANVRGRRQIIEQATTSTRRYLATLNEAMGILGDQ